MAPGRAGVRQGPGPPRARPTAASGGGRRRPPPGTRPAATPGRRRRPSSVSSRRVGGPPHSDDDAARAGDGARLDEGWGTRAVRPRPAGNATPEAARTFPDARRRQTATRLAEDVGGLDSRTYWSSFLVTFPVNFRYKAYSLAHMRTPTSVSLSVGEGVSLDPGPIIPICFVDSLCLLKGKIPLQ